MKKNNNKKSLFWISYSDLMTSLFFTMLVLFVVVVVKMGQTNTKLQEKEQQLISQRDSLIADKEKLEAITHLSEQFQALTISSHLAYDEEKRIFYVKDFMGVEIFDQLSDTIKSKFLPVVDEVGREIQEIVTTLNKNNNDFKFQLVIDGTAAIPYSRKIAHTYNPDSKKEYERSYRRSLDLYYRWKQNGLNFRGGNTEIIIAGSGFNGENRDNENEDNNKRFVIQIIPKIGRLTQ